MCTTPQIIDEIAAGIRPKAYAATVMLSFLKALLLKMSNVAVNGVALVTGGAAGIGEETGFAFAEANTSGIIFATSTLRRPKRAQKRIKNSLPTLNTEPWP
ncbi:hypothetical protein BELL_0266g00110 [Botrytis elliptica]|uniref:Uncharacterized protein n=1 Tax=Botrytis elliptica TaxID=278938 RepID=A0A4Z1JSU6_9HELO|nr:hypothetical protein BELL_0266g00110 [Botrytis elliptica]